MNRDFNSNIKCIEEQKIQDLKESTQVEIGKSNWKKLICTGCCGFKRAFVAKGSDETWG